MSDQTLTDVIPVHPHDLDLITERLLEVTEATGGAVPIEAFAELPKETLDTWRAWALRACNGLSGDRCGGTPEGHAAARKLALELAEARGSVRELRPDERGEVEGEEISKLIVDELIETGRTPQEDPPAQQIPAGSKER